MEVNKIIQGDCLTVLKTLLANSIDCCVTSPPYYGLRDYGNEGQLGLEKTPEEYVSKMVEVFAEVKRVLKKDGTLWLNLGDSYNGSGGAGGDYNAGGLKDGQPKYKGRNLNTSKPKDLIGIPWLVAFALRADGWYLRQDIIWSKPNPMPESVTDRCTKAHEYIFLLSKSAKYYYDAEAIKTEMIYPEDIRAPIGSPGSWQIDGRPADNNKGRFIKGYAYRGEGDKKLTGHSGNYDQNGDLIGNGMANKRSVWTVTTMPYAEAHFATFPERLIVDCIKAGCPEFVCNKCGKAREKIIERQPGVSVECPKTQSAHEARGGTAKPSGTVGKSGGGRVDAITSVTGLTDCGCNAGFSPGIVLDPFMGAGTTGLVARKLNRNFIGIELNAEYIKIANKRLTKELGMFI